jgi:hypothetical protein
MVDDLLNARQYIREADRMWRLYGGEGWLKLSAVE